MVPGSRCGKRRDETVVLMRWIKHLHIRFTVLRRDIDRNVPELSCMKEITDTVSFCLTVVKTYIPRSPWEVGSRLLPLAMWNRNMSGSLLQKIHITSCVEPQFGADTRQRLG